MKDPRSRPSTPRRAKGRVSRERELPDRGEDAYTRLSGPFLDDERRLREVHLPGDGLHLARIEVGRKPRHHRELVAGEGPLRKHVDDGAAHGLPRVCSAHSDCSPRKMCPNYS